MMKAVLMTASAVEARLLVVVDQVEAVVVGEVGVDAVAGEAAAQAVAAVALGGHGADRGLAGHPRARLVADAHEAAAAVDLERRLLAVGRPLAGQAVRGARPSQRGGHALEQRFGGHPASSEAAAGAATHSSASPHPAPSGDVTSGARRRACARAPRRRSAGERRQAELAARGLARLAEHAVAGEQLVGRAHRLGLAAPRGGVLLEHPQRLGQPDARGAELEAGEALEALPGLAVGEHAVEVAVEDAADDLVGPELRVHLRDRAVVPAGAAGVALLEQPQVERLARPVAAGVALVPRARGTGPRDTRCMPSPISAASWP